MTGQITVRKDSHAQAKGFDYSELAGSLQGPIRDEVKTIRRLLVKEAANAVQIGLRLQFVRTRLGRLRFQAWLKAEFALSQASASKYMCVARVFADIDRLEGIQFSALYVLANRRVNPAARQEALRLASQGEFISRARARQIVAKFQPVESSAKASQDLRRQVERVIQNLPREQVVDVLEDVLRSVRMSIDLDLSEPQNA